MTRPYERFMIEAGKKGSLKPEEIAERISERDARQSADTRSDAQRLMNEPEACRSALSGIVKAQPTLFTPLRLKLGKSRTTPHYNPAIWKLIQNK